MEHVAPIEEADSLVQEIVSGNIEAVAKTTDWTPALVNELASVCEWQVTAGATVRVLEALRSDRHSKLAIRFWADFVRTGRPGGILKIGPTHSLHIEWDPAHEDDINEAIARISELGDDQDGEMSTEEIDGFIALLQSDST